MKTTLVTGLLLSILIACGGGGGGAKGGDTYARGTNLQQQCCEALQGEPRTQCLSSIPKIEDKQVQSSEANQSTYQCVVEHFACDRATGHATQASAQAQLECIQAL